MYRYNLLAQGKRHAHVEQASLALPVPDDVNHVSLRYRCVILIAYGEADQIVLVSVTRRPVDFPTLAFERRNDFLPFTSIDSTNW